MKQGGSRNHAAFFRRSRHGWQPATGLQKNPAKGFTIVETMIVLAVTGVMFLSAVLLVSGKQGKTEFMTAINGVRQQIQQTINETASGYFPNSSNFSCTAGTPPTIDTSGSASQGTNGDCVFLGKVMQFAPSDAVGTYETYSLAGNREFYDPVLGIKREANTVAEAFPTVVAPLNVSTTLDNGLQVQKMEYTTTANPSFQPTDGVGFISSLGSYHTSCGGDKNTGTLCSGSLAMKLYAIKGTSVGLTKLNDMVNAINATSSSPSPTGAVNFVNNIDQVRICFQSGTTSNQVGIVTIGGNSSDQAVSLQIGATCP